MGAAVLVSSMRWDLRFIGLAREVAKWSKDPSTKVGAVIVRADNTIASLGFNGFPRGVPDLETDLMNRDTRLLKVVHAEINAILHSRESLHGFSLYVTPFLPCSMCAGAIIQAGITRVVAEMGEGSDEKVIRWKASFDITRDMFLDAGVVLDVISNYEELVEKGYHL